MYQRLVIPLDGSEIAERALIEATELASLSHTPMHLVRVIDSASADMAVVSGKLTDSEDTAVLLADDVDDACQYLDDVARRLGDRGHRITHEVRCGPAAGQLIDAAQPGDLYVMASHGRTGLSRWFMGSVAEEVVRRIPVPVLLVRAGTPVKPSDTRRSLAWS
ncbi:MAG TPA: universal stress protein [Thermomicrobiales bacterium]|nr:universal stress protein [Thermomicrobiales bacterium]